jgi:hypothetical protein
MAWLHSFRWNLGTKHNKKHIHRLIHNNMKKENKKFTYDEKRAESIYHALSDYAINKLITEDLLDFLEDRKEKEVITNDSYSII